MPKHRKDDSDSVSDSDSGPTDRSDPPPKKSKSGGSSAVRKNDTGETYFELEGLKRVTVREFRGKIYVDVREHYEKDGKILPGKKGISLSRSQWNKLLTLENDINGALNHLC